MKRLLDWLAVKLGYTSMRLYELDTRMLYDEVESWRNAYTDAQRRYSFAQDRLNKLMRYKHVQAVAATLDNGKPRK